MNVADDSSLQLYSSVKIAKLGAKETLSVEIVTPQNITKITPDMYRNAATTLGIEHAKITVAAPDCSYWRKCLGWYLLFP